MYVYGLYKLVYIVYVGGDFNRKLLGLVEVICIVEMFFLNSIIILI